jgi:hypothetical protein
MSADAADLIGPDETAFTLDLTAAQLKVTYYALKSYSDDFGREQQIVHKLVREIMAKLPEEASIRAIDIDTGR